MTTTTEATPRSFEADVAKLLHLMVHSVHSDKDVFLRDMVSDNVDVTSRRAGEDTASLWSSDGQGTYTIQPAGMDDAPARGTRVLLHLKEDASGYTDGFTVERDNQGAVGTCPGTDLPKDKPDTEPKQIADGAALWTKPKAEISPEDYTDFYRSVAASSTRPH